METIRWTEFYYSVKLGDFAAACFFLLQISFWCIYVGKNNYKLLEWVF